MKIKHKRLKQLNSLEKNINYGYVSTPAGELVIFVSDKGIHNILWEYEANSAEGKQSIKQFTRNNAHKLIFDAK